MSEKPTNEELYAQLINSQNVSERASAVANILHRLDEQAVEIARLRGMLCVCSENKQQKPTKQA